MNIHLNRIPDSLTGANMIVNTNMISLNALIMNERISY